MKCSFCGKQAVHYAYWHRTTPRPVIHACQHHFSHMCLQAQMNGEELRKFHPELALENAAAAIVSYELAQDPGKTDLSRTRAISTSSAG